MNSDTITQMLQAAGKAELPLREKRATPKTDAEMTRIKRDPDIDVGSEVREMGAHARRLERGLAEATDIGAELVKVIAKKDALIVALRGALSTPPPPVVPLEDVSPLVESAKQVVQQHLGFETPQEHALKKALSTFLEKHPLP